MDYFDEEPKMMTREEYDKMANYLNERAEELDPIPVALNEEGKTRLYEWIAGRLLDRMTKFLVHKTHYISHANYSVSIICNRGIYTFRLEDDRNEAEADAWVKYARREIYNFMVTASKIQLVD